MVLSKDFHISETVEECKEKMRQITTTEFGGSQERSASVAADQSTHISLISIHGDAKRRAASASTHRSDDIVVNPCHTIENNVPVS